MPEWLLYKAINDVGFTPKFRLPISTRWLLTLDCFERILYQEDALKVHFSLVSSAKHGYAARLYSDKPVCTQNSSDLCRWKSKLWTNISSWILEIHWVLLGILTGCTCPHCGHRELDLKSSSLYLSHQDTDLSSSFQKQLKASTLVQEKERPSLLCFDA